TQLYGLYPSYPILYYFTTDLIKEYTWITLAQYIFEAITLMLFVSFFFIELLMLVSFFVKNEIYVWLAGGLFLIIGVLIPPSSFNPLSYIRVDEIISGEINLNQHNDFFSFTKSMLVLFAGLSIVFILKTITGKVMAKINA
ncbi:MAG TPA: hypothetical protein GX525_05835, partial [Bacilli bacterium]|nr:hypothetical protein [Bacilli bacterium]